MIWDNKCQVHTPGLEQTHFSVSSGYDFGGSARRMSQGQMWAPWEREQVWGSVGWSRACRHEQKTSAERDWPSYPWNPRSWGRSHMRPPRGREPFSLGQENHGRRGAQLEAAAESVTEPTLIICQATPQRPAAGPEGLGHPAT